MVIEVDERNAVVQKLLSDECPSIRYWTLRDILGRSERNGEVVEAQGRIASWPPILSVLKEQHTDGYWGEPEDFYWPKWTATVWPLILLGELGVPGTNLAVKRGCEYFLKVMDGQDRS